MSLFERVHDRRDSRSVKWERMEKVYGIGDASDILPMWVADMDFPAPPAVTDALRERLEHPIFGYSYICEECKTAAANWQKKRHGLSIDTDWMLFHQGVIPAMASIIDVFTTHGDKVLVTPPVYPPFFSIPKNLGRDVLYSELKEQDGEYTIDFADFEDKLQDARLFILCNPHNPGGKLWTSAELEHIIRLCAQHDVLILSDEIHSDLIHQGEIHIPLLSVAGSERDRIFTCLAPTKTFNLAGIQAAMIVAADPHKRNLLDKHMQAHGTGSLNAFAPVAWKAAYEEGEPWLDELLDVLSSHISFAVERLEREVPGLKINKPQSTYLLWIDYRALGLSEDEAMQRLLRDGKVALEAGSKYGESGRGFLRMNIACPRTTLEDGISRVIRALGTDYNT
ncbi:MalY/PatB family protein [Planococcus sp. ISL-109]|uniref:MalY/PatB family protein n=1 Tax=Planococcus sp. ISL-109 TaxID=2819166 RepID=UPI001BE510A5|nr:MalY/PatB family protein [Planococcus sp. ISL-109]MBT2583632.1 pyridoxal phosphate-dependent aminotransferase [Planococcus sp. ISL-109]